MESHTEPITIKDSVKVTSHSWQAGVSAVSRM